MPFYSFKCDQCSQEFEIFLKIGQNPDKTPCCSSTNFKKIITKISLSGLTTDEKKIQAINDEIRENKEILEEMKKDLKNRR
ncbi:MAG: hypothetical protein HC875_40885 [Anaerolineales bacterium]|nr:hypothetical protein [Anaerolineales bacterium]